QRGELEKFPSVHGVAGHASPPAGRYTGAPRPDWTAAYSPLALNAVGVFFDGAANVAPKQAPAPASSSAVTGAVSPSAGRPSAARAPPSPPPLLSARTAPPLL